MEPVNVTHKALLIRINQNYYEGMSNQALYENTRGVWKIGRGPKCKYRDAEYALAVVHGEVKEVYRVLSWHGAGETPYETRGLDEVDDDERVEFLGERAEPETRNKYLGHSVKGYFKDGNRSPVTYVNI